MNIRYKSEIKQVEHWLNKDGGGRKNLLPWMLRKITQALQSSGKKTPDGDMESLAFYFANEATLASHIAPHSGDQWWSSYSEFGYWDDRIREARYYQWFSQYYQKSHAERLKKPSGTDPRLITFSGHPMFLFWIAYWEESKVTRSLQGILKTPQTGAFGIWENTPLFGLLLKLARMVIENEPAEANLPLVEPQTLGPYEAIFRNWNNSEGLRQALFDALEYHESRSHDDGRYDIGEFSKCPAVLLPLEFMAIRAVRDNRGLETPVPDHWLLQTPLYLNLPKTLPPCEDKLLADILKEVAKYFPIHLDDLSLHFPPPLALHKQYTAADPPPPLTPCFSIEEESEKTGFLRRAYHLNAKMRFVLGETLESHWPRLLEAFAAWRKKRRNDASILTITFQSDPTLHPALYKEFTSKTQTDSKLDAWIESLQAYTLSFQELDGTNCRDLVWEKQPNGNNLFTELRFTL